MNLPFFSNYDHMIYGGTLHCHIYAMENLLKVQSAFTCYSLILFFVVCLSSGLLGKVFGGGWFSGQKNKEGPGYSSTGNRRGSSTLHRQAW